MHTACIDNDRMIQQPQSMMGETTMATPNTATAPNSATIYIDTQHEDLVHDSQMDFYGSKLATCSSGKLFIFTVSYPYVFLDLSQSYPTNDS